MAVTYFDSENDSGAPKFTASGGTSNIIEIFDAILINGYGSKQGLGWTKAATSQVAGSNRTVYQNKSAHSENMYLIVESSPTDGRTIRFQIADQMNTPEDYSGYSFCVNAYFQYTPYEWKAVGDGRTLIFIIHPGGLNTFNFSNALTPAVIYMGDLDTMTYAYPKGWALLGPSMLQGKMSDMTVQGDHRGVLNSLNYNDVNFQRERIVSQLPGENWSEGKIYFAASSFVSPAFAINPVNGFPTKKASEFQDNASVRVPYFVLLQQKFMFRLRGVYNIFPWLTVNDEAGKNAYLRKVTISNVGYLPFPNSATSAANTPMTVYVQIDGDW